MTKDDITSISFAPLDTMVMDDDSAETRQWQEFMGNGILRFLIHVHTDTLVFLYMCTYVYECVCTCVRACRRKGGGKGDGMGM